MDLRTGVGSTDRGADGRVRFGRGCCSMARRSGVGRPLEALAVLEADLAADFGVRDFCADLDADCGKGATVRGDSVADCCSESSGVWARTSQIASKDWRARAL